MEYDKATAISIEAGMQNSGLAVSLAAANFAANPLATLRHFQRLAQHFRLCLRQHQENGRGKKSQSICRTINRIHPPRACIARGGFDLGAIF